MEAVKIRMKNRTKLDTLLAVGKTSEIYAWEDGVVLKLFNSGMPIEFAQHEAAMTQAVFDAGLPLPQVGEVIEVDGRFGLTMQHITGPSLLEIWLQNPADTEPIARLLADLHKRIHDTPAPSLESLPTQHDWLHNSIQESESLSSSHIEITLRTLSNLPDGATLCHGDLHPNNILFDDNGQPIIIDWFTAVSGHPVGDIAQTCLLLTSAPLPDELATLLTSELREMLQSQYVQMVLERDLLGRESLDSWIAVAKAATPNF